MTRMRVYCKDLSIPGFLWVDVLATTDKKMFGKRQGTVQKQYLVTWKQDDASYLALAISCEHHPRTCLYNIKKIKGKISKDFLQSMLMDLGFFNESEQLVEQGVFEDTLELA